MLLDEMLPDDDFIASIASKLRSKLRAVEDMSTSSKLGKFPVATLKQLIEQLKTNLTQLEKRIHEPVPIGRYISKLKGLVVVPAKLLAAEIGDNAGDSEQDNLLTSHPPNAAKKDATTTGSASPKSRKRKGGKHTTATSTAHSAGGALEEDKDEDSHGAVTKAVTKEDIEGLPESKVLQNSLTAYKMAKVQQLLVTAAKGVLAGGKCEDAVGEMLQPLREFMQVEVTVVADNPKTDDETVESQSPVSADISRGDDTTGKGVSKNGANKGKQENAAKPHANAKGDGSAQTKLQQDTKVDEDSDGCASLAKFLSFPNGEILEKLRSDKTEINDFMSNIIELQSFVLGRSAPVAHLMKQARPEAIQGVIRFDLNQFIDLAETWEKLSERLVKVSAKPEFQQQYKRLVRSRENVNTATASRERAVERLVMQKSGMDAGARERLNELRAVVKEVCRKVLKKDVELIR
jgi:hypothetical protein